MTKPLPLPSPSVVSEKLSPMEPRALTVRVRVRARVRRAKYPTPNPIPNPNPNPSQGHASAGLEPAGAPEPQPQRCGGVMASGGPASTPLGARGEGPPRTWTPLRALTPRDARRFELETRPSQR